MNFFVPKNIVLISGDILITFISAYAGVFLRLYGSFDSPLLQYFPFLPKAITFSVFIIFTCFLLDLYDIEKGSGRKETFLKILFAGLFTEIGRASCRERV